ncbi:MAG TPA: hypothetical protein DCL38_04325 [Lachnospiraceae bacterium]|nr:hypothetical protein [Lachnospiraceae bacterium]
MKKIFKELAAAQIMALLITGCASAVPAPVETAPKDGEQQVTEAATEAETAEAAVNEAEAETEAAAEASADAPENEALPYDDPKSLPEYTYTGTEEYLDVISKYMIDQDAELFGEERADVYIPCSLIAETDDTDPENILVYGVFNIDGYDLLNTTLAAVNGAQNYGIFHLKKNGDSAEVISAELPLTEEESIDLFAPIPGLYERVVELENSQGNAARAEAIASYINTNGLNITQWQDHGKAPEPVLNAPDTPEAANFYTFKSDLGYQITYDLREYSHMFTGDEDIYGRIEPDDVWTGTLMSVEKTDGDDTDAAIASALSDTGAEGLTGTDAVIGDGISCKRAAYDEKLSDGRIFRYICYAVPAGGSVITVVIETTVEKGISELSAEELEKTFEATLQTFTLL